MVPPVATRANGAPVIAARARAPWHGAPVIRATSIVASVSLAVILLAGCSLGPAHVDKVPPATVQLQVAATTDTSVSLTWIAPGDNGNVGQAASYDLRYRTPDLTPAEFDSATQVTSGVPTPALAGTRQTAVVVGLTALSHYGFALRTADAVPNWSDLSNIVEAVTSPSSKPDRRWDVPREAPTIQAGIDSAAVGDSVVMASGTYHEHDIRLKPGVIVRSAVGSPDSVIVDAQSAGAVFVASGVDSTTALMNLTLANGAAGQGAGLSCLAYASPLIANCIFRNNQAIGQGGGLYCEDYSSPLVRGCVFQGNGAQMGGAACCVLYSSPAFSQCAFTGNAQIGEFGGALYCASYSSPTLTGCTLAGNSAGTSGGALDCQDFSSPQVTGCIFSGNSAGGDGGGLACASHASPTVAACTFYQNSAVRGGAISVREGARPTVTNSILASTSGGATVACQDTSTVTFTCSDLFGNPKGDWVGCVAGQDQGSGNLSVDPLFCAPQNGDFSLQSNSPCQAGGTCPLMGAVSTPCGGLVRRR